MGHATVLPLRLWQLGFLGLAALAGLVAGLVPALGVGLALGTAYVALVVTDLAVGLTLFVGVLFLESISGFGALSLAKAAGALLALAWIAIVATDGPRGRNFAKDHGYATMLIALLGAWVSLSIVWAEFPGVAFDSAQRWLLNLTLFFIVYVAVREARHVRWIFAVFVIGALTSAAVGILGGASAVAGRLDGSGVNANELGELLIAAAVLAATLGMTRTIALPARLLAFAGSALAVGALLATVSRGALLGLAVALLVTPLLIGPRRRVGALAMIVVGAVMIVGYLVTFAPEGNIERLTSSYENGSGRTEIWTLGLRMVQANPVHGVGAGNYANSTIHFLLEPGVLTRSQYIIDDPKAAHNVYLQALAEIGIVGLLLFLSVVAFALRELLRAARRFNRIGDREMEVLARGLLIALTGLLASLFFSTAIYSKQLWLLLAVSVAVGAMSRERETQRTRPAETLPTTRAQLEPGARV